MFYVFTNGDWHFRNNKIYDILKIMSNEERIEFDCDTKQINWKTYIKNYIHGLGIWCLRED